MGEQTLFRNININLLGSTELRSEFLENILQTTNNNLVHYSLTSKGSALYYQKIMLNKIFRARGSSFNFILNNSKYKTDRQATRYLVLGGIFQHSYHWMVNMNQIRRGISDTIFGNDSKSLGSFKNLSFNRGWLRGSAVLKKTAEAKKTKNIIINEWAAFYTSNGGLSTLFMQGYHSVYNTMGLKSQKLIPNWFNLITFKKSPRAKPMLDYISVSLSSLVHFIRTIWFNFTLNLNMYWRQLDFTENTGNSKLKLKTTEMYHFLFASNINFDQFPAQGSMPRFQVDLVKNLRAGPRGASFYRKLLRNHKTWRLGMAFWAKKIWQYKKTYRFWKYMRGMSNYMFRGFHMFSIFMNRLDIYIMRMFPLKNLRFIRVLIDAGHIFYGTYTARNPKLRVTRYSLVSLSKRATNWAVKRNFRKYIQNELFSEKKAAIQNIKNTALRYCRQQKDLAIWGRTQFYRFAMFFGENINILNMDSKKTNFFSLNYFYSQRAVASAWW